MLSDFVFVEVASEICFKNSDQLVQKLYGHGCIDISFCGCKQNDIFMGNVNEACSINVHNWRFFVLFCRNYFCAKLNCFLTAIKGNCDEKI